MNFKPAQGSFTFGDSDLLNCALDDLIRAENEDKVKQSRQKKFTQILEDDRKSYEQIEKQKEREMTLHKPRPGQGITKRTIHPSITLARDSTREVPYQRSPNYHPTRPLYVPPNISQYGKIIPKSNNFNEDTDNIQIKIVNPKANIISPNSIKVPLRNNRNDPEKVTEKKKPIPEEPPKKEEKEETTQALKELVGILREFKSDILQQRQQPVPVPQSAPPSFPGYQNSEPKFKPLPLPVPRNVKTTDSDNEEEVPRARTPTITTANTTRSSNTSAPATRRPEERPSTINDFFASIRRKTEKEAD